MLPVELGWQYGVKSGWMLFAYHLALGLAREGFDVRFPGTGDHTQIPATLLPSILAMTAPGDRRERRWAINGLGNHFPAPPDIPNRIHVALDVFEDTTIPPEKLAQITRFDHHIACSTWARDVMRGYGIDAPYIAQGYDDSLFYIAPRRRPVDDKFYVFSGGKIELRKAQDVVVAAFKAFSETPEGKGAVLVTAWQNRWIQTMIGINASGYVKGVPITRLGAQDINAWLEANGIPAESRIDVGMVSQAEFANLIRECDVALFPNRCESANNMVLPEVMASGIPCIVSQNTGHLDIGLPAHCLPLTHQSPVTVRCPLFTGYAGWGESSVEECVERLREARTMSAERRSQMTARAASFVQREFGWRSQAPKFAAFLTERE